MTLDIHCLRGAALKGALPAVAALRIAVFREWPYLYDGDVAYEQRYLAPMSDTPEAVLVAAYDGPTLVGASTAMPLKAQADEFSAAFEGSGLPIEQIFYCAESVLLPEYRGQGAGHRFFDLREAAARTHGFRFSAFCSVLRPADHPALPPAYRPLEPFWRARGYAPLPGITARFAWKDVDQKSETEKDLQFWLREL